MITGSTNASSGVGMLRPRARIMRTLGNELISSETVAVIELVKNSYDADAHRVLVRFNGPLLIGQGSIEVIDDGHGMDQQTLRGAWLEPATPVKRRSSRSEGGKRRILGEKGIGRFAAARLGDILEVVSRRDGAGTEVRVAFDWRQFDDEERYLDEIEVRWEEAQPREISAGGTIEALWGIDGQPQEGFRGHGTILRMTRLRLAWGMDDILKLRTDLARLVSPFPSHEIVVEKDELQIFLEVPPPWESLSGEVSAPEALRNPHYSIRGTVDSTGHADLRLAIRGKSGLRRIRKRLPRDRDRPPQCGPFDIELRAWDRDAPSMRDLAQERGSTIADVRRDLNAVAGVNVYRDGFRVLPYGEPRNDWLRLDLRRVQNPTLRLSNNQIVGYAMISADQNPELRDQSNREGLIEGPALDDLRDLVTMVLAELEQQRYAARPRRERIPRPGGGLFAGFDLRGIHDTIRQRHPNDTELLELIGESQKDLERRVEDVQEVLARYRRLATLGQLIDIVLHDGRAPLAKVGNEAHLGRRDAERARKVTDELVARLADRFRTIGDQSDVLATVFRRIEPFGGRKRGRPSEVVLERVIADAFGVLETEIREVGASIQLPEGDTPVTVDPAEIQEVVINLLQNSLYWLRQVRRGQRAIAVQTRRTSKTEVEMIFSDYGPGVDPEFRERIFEPYFSTKPSGVGLGLTIAGEIVTEYYAGSLELVEGGPLPGATFRVVLRKRV